MTSLHRSVFTLLSCLVVVSGTSSVAQDGSELELFELEEELKAQTKVASQRAQTVRETPGVVTMLGRDEILNSGARDLIDVLRLVPGFFFGVDVEGVVGVGFRGNWGHEGKVLLLIDGQEMNENLYSTLQFGHHYPLENVERVEIIRGPGSIIYGGYAELAVINVVTRGTQQLNGAYASARYGQYGNTFGHRTVNLGYGQKFEQVEGLGVTLSGTFGQANRSGREYVDTYGSRYSFADSSRLGPAFLNLGAQYKDLHLRVLYDAYSVWSRDGFDAELGEPYDLNFITAIADLRYELKPSDRVTVTPRFNFKRTMPWRDPNPGSPLHYDKTTDRITGRLTLNYEVSDEVSLMVGGELYLDRAWLNAGESDLNSSFGGRDQVSYQNRAVFAEVLVEHWIANLVAGARFEDHSAVGNSFVPRIALTKLIDRFHVKALYSRAFRAPGIENINLGVNIRPENTTVLEAELGYQLTDSVFVSANAFDVGIQNPIVYFYDEVTEAEGYTNFTRTGTRGVEAQLRFKRPGMYATLGYSFYVANQNEVESYQVEDDDQLLLGAPAHKVTLLSGFNVWRDLHVNPSVMFATARYAYVGGFTDDGSGTLTALPPAALVNLFVTYRNLGVKGLDVSAGVYDLLDAAPGFPQPYAGGHAVHPEGGREIMARVGYTYPFE